MQRRFSVDLDLVVSSLLPGMLCREAPGKAGWAAVMVAEFYRENSWKSSAQKGYTFLSY